MSGMLPSTCKYTLSDLHFSVVKLFLKSFLVPQRGETTPAERSSLTPPPLPLSPLLPRPLVVMLPPNMGGMKTPDILLDLLRQQPYSMTPNLAVWKTPDWTFSMRTPDINAMLIDVSVPTCCRANVDACCCPSFAAAHADSLVLALPLALPSVSLALLALPSLSLALLVPCPPCSLSSLSLARLPLFSCPLPSCPMPPAAGHKSAPEPTR